MKIASVPYINALPLTYYLSDNVFKIAPSLMVQELLSDNVDVALLPVFSILKHKLYVHLDAGLIGCDGPAKSVGFYTRPHIQDLSQIQSIYYDIESASSIYLAKIIFQKFYHKDPSDIEAVHFDNRESADAQILIGDKALFFKDSKYKYWDLGQLWKEKTGCAFVFAAWASKKELLPEEKNHLIKARDMGLKNRTPYLQDFSLEKQRIIKDYLSHHILYKSSAKLEAGMDLYRLYLRDYGYIQ